MFEVSEKASEIIKKQFLEGREEPRSIRILEAEGGWKGPYLVMAFDQPRENDQVFTEGNVTFLIEKTLFENVKPIKIDYVEGVLGSGFRLKSELSKGAEGGANCESICGSC